jgi:EpsD family peptidyl-prolyl cis-trans isomerase
MFMLVVLFGSVACSKKNQGDSKKSNTQVVAKVNGEEITIYQVNFLLSQLGQINQEQAKAASKQVLVKLVEQELLKQQALSDKLDKDPVVMQGLNATRSQLLAQAYLERLVAKAPKPSSSEIEAFRKEHSELFENRHLFNLQELVVAVNKDKFAEIEAGLKPLKGIDEIAAWLKTHNYPYSINSNVKAAEQLPMDLLKRLQPLKPGEVLMIATPTSLNILHLVGSESAPISLEKATPIIEQYFLNQNKSGLAKKEMALLNEKANIQFEGMFAEMKKSDLMQPDAMAAKATNNAPKESSALTKSTVGNPNTIAKPSASSSSIDKGLSGL